MSDKIFDDTDNMFVFFVQSGEDLRKVAAPVVQKFLAAYPDLSHVKFFYTRQTAEREGSSADAVRQQRGTL